MEKIDKLFDEVRDAEECHSRWVSLKDEKAELEKEVRRLEAEARKVEAMNLEKEIEQAKEDYRCVLEDVERVSLSSMECGGIGDLEVVFSKIKDKDVLLEKSLGLLKRSVAVGTMSLGGPEAPRGSADGCSEDLVVLRMSKDVERILELGEGSPEMQKRCYDSFRSEFRETAFGVVPRDLRVFQDGRSVFLVFRGRGGGLPPHGMGEDAVETGLEDLLKYKMVGHAVFEVLRDNLRMGVLERGLSDEEVEESNVLLKNTEFHIRNVPEWRLDVVMKEIIDMTKGPRSMEVEECGGDDRMPRAVSGSYKRFLGCFAVFGTLRSKRREKGEKVVNRAIGKLLDPKRYEPSVYSHFVGFADITHFLRAYPEHALGDELSRRKEELFFDAVRESAQVNVDLGEPLVTLKLYFKQKHVDFVENLELFVPRTNRNLFEIQFFEMVDDGLMERVQGLRAPRSSTVQNVVSLIDYVLDLAFHLPAGAIRNQDRLRSYRQILSLERNDVVRSYRSGKLVVSQEEFVILCSLAFRDPEDRRLLLDAAGE